MVCNASFYIAETDFEFDCHFNATFEPFTSVCTLELVRQPAREREHAKVGRERKRETLLAGLFVRKESWQSRQLTPFVGRVA